MSHWQMKLAQSVAGAERIIYILNIEVYAAIFLLITRMWLSIPVLGFAQSEY